MHAPRVAIFRKRLLSYSETFIADQGQFLPHYRPLYCGFEKDESGYALIDSCLKDLARRRLTTVGPQDALAAETDAGHHLMGFTENSRCDVRQDHSEALFT